MLVAAAWADEDPSASLQTALHAAIKTANPEYQNGGVFRVQDGRLVSINLMRCKGVSDLSPLRRFDLSAVSNVSLYNATNIADISPLQGCRLTSLNLERCSKINDLAPLQGMPLKWLRMYACSSVKDLSPLRGMPLEHLDIGLNSQIEELAALENMKLHDLRLDNCPKIKDISVIRGMPLTYLTLFGCRSIHDYSPLSSLQLETIYFSPELLSAKEILLVRGMDSLKKIGTTWNDYRKEATPEQFWKRYDAGEFQTEPNAGR